jgi:hypothetical protein
MQTLLNDTYLDDPVKVADQDGTVKSARCKARES